MGFGITDRFATPQFIREIRRWGAPAVVALAASALTALTAAMPADAASKPAKPAVPTEVTAPRPAGQAIMAIVSIKSQNVTIYDADGWIMRAPVSTGVKGRETPAGVFSVVERKEDHRSNMYDDAWMPHMNRITWNGIALHGGPLPGYAASHGCIRLPFDFAKKLFPKTYLSMRVIISPNDATPEEISHPALLVPKAEAITAAPIHAESAAREAMDAVKKVNEAKKAVPVAARAAAAAPGELRKLEAAKARAEAELKSADKALAAATTDEAKAKAEEQQKKAAAKVEDLAKQVDTAKANVKLKAEAAAAAKDAVKAAEAKKAATAKAALDAKLSLQPVSVYISRATQKIYVRRPTNKPFPDGGEVIGASIEKSNTIRNADKRIGTHVITAMKRTDGGGLSWSSVTIDGSDSAKGALDRITIPKEVLDRIAATALPRSSIIISDEPLHKETNYRTEFVVALSDQPQGGLITRPPSPPIKVAREDGFFGGFGFGFGGWDANPNPRGGAAPRRNGNNTNPNPFFGGRSVW
jgi:hypothetical protein